MTMLMTNLMTTLRTGLAAISKHLGPPYAKLRALVRKPGFQRGAFAVAVILFVGGLWFSIKARPDLLEQLHPGRFLTIVFIFSPLILGLNAAIFRSIARCFQARSIICLRRAGRFYGLPRCANAAAILLRRVR